MNDRAAANHMREPASQRRADRFVRRVADQLPQIRCVASTFICESLANTHQPPAAVMRRHDAGEKGDLDRAEARASAWCRPIVAGST